MKKFFMLAIVAMSMTFAACSGGVEGKAKSMCESIIEAIKKGDMGTATKIDKEMTEWVSTLSAKDVEKVKAVQKTMNSVLEDALKGSKE